MTYLRQSGQPLDGDVTIAPRYASGEGWLPSFPERDRLWPQLFWELLLAGAVVGVYLLAARAHTSEFGPDGLRRLALQAALIGFIAVGLSFSIRAAVPNLAVGTIASGAGVMMARLVNDAHWGYGAAAPATILAAAGVGFLLWAVVAGLNVPAWAASLGASVLLAGGLLVLADGSLDLADPPRPAFGGWAWFGAFAAASVLGGIAWLSPGLRRSLSGFRGDRDPATRPPPGGVLGSMLALVISSGLAAAAGMLGALQLGAGSPIAFETQWLVALGAVLLGGVSAFGRRGGVFGTALAVVLLVLVQRWMLLNDHGAGAFTLVVGAAIVGGLALTRVFESTGHKRSY
jgi:ribose/xylose/arabinose/galactoside ABC-type transport system permease subunit